MQVCEDDSSGQAKKLVGGCSFTTHEKGKRTEKSEIIFCIRKFRRVEKKDKERAVDGV